MDGTSVEPPVIIGGRYEVVAPLGEGGLATVYRVRHLQLGSDHALKILKLQAKGIRERLMLEGRVQATLRHPNLVSVTDVVEVDGAPGLIMEFVDGPDLHHFLQSTRLRGRDLDEMVEGILSAVAEAHSKGLVHRDLKPGNILVAKAGGKLIPKITDFGLAKLLDSDERNSSTTRTGMTMGTPAYMAPEQIRDAKNVDHRADVFSLGAILYEMATGQKAFPGEDILELFLAIANGRYKPPRELEPELPERMVKAIDGALQVDLQARVQDCGTLLAMWRGEAAGAEASLPAPKARRAPTAASTSNPTYNDEAADTLAPRSVAPAKAPTLAPPRKTEATVASPAVVRKGPPLWFVAVAGAALLTIAGSTLLLVGVLGYAAFPTSTADVSDVSSPPVPVPVPAPAPAPDPSTLGTPSSGTPSPSADATTSSGTASSGTSTGATSSGTAVSETSSGTTSSGATSSETSTGTTSAAKTSPATATSDAKTSSGTTSSGTTSSKKRTTTSTPTPAATPAPTPAPAPADATPPADAAPALAPNEALVKVVGDAKRVWLQGATGRFPAGAVPAGNYHITAFFDAGDPVSIGDVDLTAAETLTVRCSAEMRTCRYQEAK